MKTFFSGMKHFFKSRVMIMCKFVNWASGSDLSFVCRSTSGDTVQLIEQSLDTNLLNNAVKLKFTHCAVLPAGVNIQETLNNVIILIATNQSVHRMVLPHPTRMYRCVSNPPCLYLQWFCNRIHSFEAESQENECGDTSAWQGAFQGYVPCKLL